MAKIIALNKHFSGVSLVYAGPYSTQSFDAPLESVCITPLPDHSDFQAINVVRTLAISTHRFDISLEMMKARPSWSTNPEDKFLALHIAFGSPAEPRKLINDLTLSIEEEFLRTRIPFTPSRIVISCKHARLALPAPAIAS